MFMNKATYDLQSSVESLFLWFVSLGINVHYNQNNNMDVVKFKSIREFLQYTNSISVVDTVNSSYFFNMDLRMWFSTFRTLIWNY